MTSEEIVAKGDELFGGDLAIFCDLSECATAIDAANKIESLIADLKRTADGFMTIEKREDPNDSIRNSALAERCRYSRPATQKRLR